MGPRGLLLGFAAHEEKAIRQGLVRLAAALGDENRRKMPRAKITLSEMPT
jgi:hypothetical protein